MSTVVRSLVDDNEAINWGVLCLVSVVQCSSGNIAGPGYIAFLRYWLIQSLVSGLWSTAGSFHVTQSDHTLAKLGQGQFSWNSRLWPQPGVGGKDANRVRLVGLLFGCAPYPKRINQLRSCSSVVCSLKDIAAIGKFVPSRLLWLNIIILSSNQWSMPPHAQIRTTRTLLICCWWLWHNLSFKYLFRSDRISRLYIVSNVLVGG